jgi:predicted methyltransferase
MAANSAQVDLRQAINAVSDVIQNRPLPLREFDQIYMKAGDMVMQTMIIAQRFAGRRLVFVGDGDSISLCVAYLMHREVLEEGPESILVLDFDERMVNAIERFADTERISDKISARLYNCIDPLPEELVGQFTGFYTNPPWGASNSGESVKVFAERGMEACGEDAVGVVVIADDKDVPWSQRVLYETQKFALEQMFFVQEMQTKMHAYHLDDAPLLRSCNLFFRAHPDRKPAQKSYALHGSRLEDFYGKDQNLRVQYVRERLRVDYGKAPSDTYELEVLEKK